MGVEHDSSEVFVLPRCIPEEVFTPLHVGGCEGDLFPPQGFEGADPPPNWGSKSQQSHDEGFRDSAPEAKNKCKIAL